MKLHLLVFFLSLICAALHAGDWSGPAWIFVALLHLSGVLSATEPGGFGEDDAEDAVEFEDEIAEDCAIIYPGFDERGARGERRS